MLAVSCCTLVVVRLLVALVLAVADVALATARNFSPQHQPTPIIIDRTSAIWLRSATPPPSQPTTPAAPPTICSFILLPPSPPAPSSSDNKNTSTRHYHHHHHHHQHPPSPPDDAPSTTQRPTAQAPHHAATKSTNITSLPKERYDNPTTSRSPALRTRSNTRPSAIQQGRLAHTAGSTLRHELQRQRKSKISLAGQPIGHCIHGPPQRRHDNTRRS